MAAQIPGIVYQALKDNVPEMDDASKVKLWDSLVETQPDVVQMDPTEVAKSVVNIAKQTRGKIEANKVSTSVPQPVMPASTVQSPYVGSTMAARNPTNPQAELMNQFDPQQMKQAFDAYAAKYNESLPQRNLSQGIGALGGPATLKASQESWDRNDAQNKLMTLEQQKQLQDQATAGLAGATSVTNQMRTSAADQLDRSKGIQDITQATQKSATGGIDLKQKQMLYTPGTLQAKMAFLQLQQQAQTSGKALPPEMSPENSSVADMLPYMEGSLLKSWKDASEGRKAGAEASVAEAVGNNLVNTPGPTVVNWKGTMMNIDDIPVSDEIKAKIRADAATRQPQQPTLTPEGQDRTKFMTISSAIGNMPPLPSTTIEAEAGARKKVATGDIVENWNTYGKPAVARIRDLINKGVYTGPLGQITGILPGASEQQQLLTYLAKLNDINPTLLPAPLSTALTKGPGDTGYSGKLLASMTKETLTKLLDNAEADMGGLITNRQQRNSAEKAGVTPSEYPLSAEAQSLKSSQPTSSSLPIVTTQAQYDALTPGSRYQDKNGKPYKKGGK